MMKYFLIVILLFSKVIAQTTLPVTEYKGTKPTLPLVCYLTGDGGMNAFTKAIIQAWTSLGYSVIALDSKSYFWKKQTPEQAATDVSSLLTKYMAAWKCSSTVLTGYSFGADVLPFIQNRLPVVVSNKVSEVVMISPSNTTDFEVHLFYGNSGSSVPAEINKLMKPGLVVFGRDEKDTPFKTINNKNITVFLLPGDHHYNDDAKTVVQQIVSKL